MNTWAPWRIVGALVAVALLFGVRVASLWPAGGTDLDPRVRLSWSARPERVEVCRQLSDAELQALPEHMRMRVTCEGRFARYLLTLGVDGQVRVSDTVRGGGLRNDRPIHLLRDYRVPAGEHRLLVSLVRLDSTGSRTVADGATASAGALVDRSAREREERERRAAEAMPASLVLDTTIALTRGRVLLVTYLNEQRRLAVGARE